MASSSTKKLLPLLLLALLPFYAAFAETPEKRASMRHEFRLGWGDQMFESLVWQNPSYIIDNMSESYTSQYKEHYRYTQHWFAGYQWRVNKWFSLGAMADFSACLWDDVTRNGQGVELDREANRNFWNLVVMPEFRFTWLNRKYVSLYSSLGAGLCVNGGTETDFQGRHTVCAAALDIALVGISVDWSRWFAFVELGGLYALKGQSAVYLCNSRIVSAGVGIRF
ncbi:MAG: hypothetical protein ACI395_06305 [Candidatus Cryptobacteroides sp.]